MEALNAARLTPVSALLSDRKQEPRRNPTLFHVPQHKSKRIQGGLAALSSVLNTSALAAKALTYEEALQQSVDGASSLVGDVDAGGLIDGVVGLTSGEALQQAVDGSSASAGAVDTGGVDGVLGLTYEEALRQTVDGSSSSAGGVDAGGLIDGLIGFATENPVLLAGGVAILAIPLVLSQLLKKPKPWGVESARRAYAKLGDDPNAQLVDIRPSAELRKVGSPDIRGLLKKPAAIPYKGSDKSGFLKKVSLKFKEAENTTLFILDKFDGNSELVAELVTVNGFKAAYAIKDGAEGPRGWLNSTLPWIAPSKTPTLDFSSLTDPLGDIIGDGSEGVSVALGIATAAGLGFLAFSEVETILQVLGSAALIQFVSRKLLFAEDRKETLSQIDEFLTTKIAPNELADEIKQIGKAILPTVRSNSLPAPLEEAKEESVPEPILKVEAAAEPVKEVNSATPSEVKPERVDPTFLSPYPSYPDFKPPTSPSPSQP